MFSRYIHCFQHCSNEEAAFKNIRIRCSKCAFALGLSTFGLAAGAVEKTVPLNLFRILPPETTGAERRIRTNHCKKACLDICAVVAYC